MKLSRPQIAALRESRRQSDEEITGHHAYMLAHTPGTLRSLERLGLVRCVNRDFATDGARITNAGREALGH